MAVERDISLRISAQLAAFRKEVAKMPDITGKQATRAALKMQAAFVKAEQNSAKSALKAGQAITRATAKAVAKAAKEAGKAGKEAGKRFGDGFEDIFGKVSFAITPGDIKDAAQFAFDLASQTAELRNQLIDTETRTDIFAETVGGLRHAFAGAGLAAEKLDGFLLPLPKRFDDARRGTGEAVLGLERLGFKVEELNGPFKSNNALMVESLKRLQAVEDGAGRTAIAMEIFGEQGSAALAALGGTELELYVDQAERFGVGVGPEAAASAKQWQHAMADLSLVTQGAAAGVSDFLNIGGAVDQFSVNIVFLTSLVSTYVDSVTTGFKRAGEAVEAALAGDVAWLQLLADQNEEGIDSIGEVIAAAREEAKAFKTNRDAIRANAAANEELAAALSVTTAHTKTNAQATSEAAKAQREAEKAERDRIKALEAQFKAVEQLVAAGNKSADAFLTDRQAIDAALNREITRLEELRLTAAGTAIAQIAFTRAVAAAKAAASLESAKIDFEDAERADELLRDFEKAAKEADKKAEEDAETAKEAREERAFDAIGLAQDVADTIVSITEQQVAKTTALLDASRDRQLSDIAQLRAAREKAGEADKAAITAEIQIRRAAGKAERGELNATLKERKKAAMIAFRASQGAALFEIGVRTLVNAVALNAPPPVGLGPGIGAAFAIATGAAAAGAVAAKKPPKFYQGRGAVGGGGLQPGEQVGILHPEEGVASKQAMQVPGFADMLDALNKFGEAATSRGGGQPVRAFVLQRDVSTAMLRESAGDGDFGALMSSSPGHVRVMR